jgi:polyketide cyclase/dehydrase/lipid transport protein
MKPVTVSVVVDRPQRVVFEYLATLRNRPRFTDHFLLEWSFSGPPRGVGAKARTRIHASVAKDWVDLEIVETTTPDRIVEHAEGARGKRLTVGVYALAPVGGGATRVEYETHDEQAPRTERVMHPLQRPWVKRVNAKALQRLKENLEC